MNRILTAAGGPGPYDPKKDFEPIVHFGYLASSLSVHPGLPVKTFAELLPMRMMM